MQNELIIIEPGYQEILGGKYVWNDRRLYAGADIDAVCQRCPELGKYKSCVCGGYRSMCYTVKRVPGKQSL